MLRDRVGNNWVGVGWLVGGRGDDRRAGGKERRRDLS